VIKFLLPLVQKALEFVGHGNLKRKKEGKNKQTNKQTNKIYWKPMTR